MKHIGLLINPRSGKGLIRQQLYSVIEYFHKRGCITTVVPVAIAPDTVEILGEKLETFDLIICCGGDGTLNHTAATLMQLKNPPTAAYLPMGSTNDFANTMRYSSHVLENCKVALYGKPALLDIGIFNKTKSFCYIAGFGAFTEVSYSTPQEMKNNLGHLAYLIQGLKALPINTSIAATIQTDNGIFQGDFLYGSFSNSTSIGGFPSPMGSEVVLDDGKFELLLIRAPKNLMDFNNLVASLAQQNFSNPYIRFVQTNKLNIVFEKEVDFTLDGEYGGSYRGVSMMVQPRAFKVHLPLEAPLVSKEKLKNMPQKIKK